MVLTPLPPRLTSSGTSTTATTNSTTSAWGPWANLDDSTPNRAYLEYFRTATNSLHPSCSNTATAAPAAAPASPMEVDMDSLELEEITLVGGQDDYLLEEGPRQGRQQQQEHGRRRERAHRSRREAPRRSHKQH